jgi:hypothetical protein
VVQGVAVRAVPVNDLIFLPGDGGGVDLSDADGVSDISTLSPDHASKAYRTYWREPGIDQL